VSVAVLRPVAVRPRTRRDVALAVGIAAVVLVAFAVRLRLLTDGAAIAASDGYDDGVYYAAADALIHGRLPYRDFLLLHPPGITIALAPFAAIGALFGDAVGVALGRLAFVGIGAMNAGLVAVVAARHSRRAALVAGGCAAVFFPLAYAERSTLLEPLGSALLLWAVLVAWRAGERRGSLVAGLVAGLAVDVKIWSVVPVVLLGLIGVRRRRLFFGGAVLSAGVVALPFLAADPVAMIREVLLDQVGRPESIARSHSTVHRLVVLGSDPKTTPHLAALLAAAVLLLVAIAAVGAWRVRWARTFVVTAAASGAVVLISPSFFPHYVGFVAPWMMLVLGVGAAELTRPIRPKALAAVVLLVPLIAVTAVNGRADLRTRVPPQPVAAVRAALAGRNGCVLSDDPGLLADIGRLTPDLRLGCPLWPDVTGWTYDRDRLEVDGHAVSRPRNGRWQGDVVQYLTSGDTVILARRGTGLSAASLQELEEHRLIARAGSVRVYATRE
jgi:hypothetical protein